MLESIEIFIDLNSQNIRVHDLIENFAAHNYDCVEFTAHVENSNLRLRLLNKNQSSVYDGSVSVDNFSRSITRILSKKDMKFTVIEHLNSVQYLDEFQEVTEEESK